MRTVARTESGGSCSDDRDRLAIRFERIVVGLGSGSAHRIVPRFGDLGDSPFR